jgi:uncharacterized protein YaeQ
MALGATLYVLNIDLADSDRGVYQALELRVARHPSESADHLLTRVIAYCAEYGEGVAFSKGLFEPDEPTLVVRDLTGVLRAWIDVGAPEAARLHRASKAAPRVAIYTHKDPRPWLARIAGERIHRAEAIEIYAFDPQCLAEAAQKLERRMSLSVTLADRHLYLLMGDVTLDWEIQRIPLEAQPR